MDFHTHTPASNDYGKGPDQVALKQTTPEEWLLDYMRAGLDAVAVTDHNSGEWVDKLKAALASPAVQQHANYRKLVLYPGVELSANGGTHILAIFDPSATTSNIDALLGACEFDLKHRGTSDHACRCSPVQLIEKITRAGAVPILAHVDVPTGAFVDLKGNTLLPLAEHEDLYAYEQQDPAFSTPPLIAPRAQRWTQVLGSDSHHRTGTPGQRFPGCHFTWVKMEQPDLEGLKLALLDGNGMSVNRSDAVKSDPNQLPDLWIEYIKVSNARRMGNGSPLKTFFSPKLNTIVGGRGTGKSTLLEFLRMAFGRSNEVPKALREEFDAYFGPDQLVKGEGAYRSNTTVEVVVWKDGAHIALRFQAGSAEPASYVENVDEDWIKSVGSIHSRFPIRLYSQKQVFSMANDRLGLLKGIDQHPDVDVDSWRKDFEATIASFLEARSKVRQLRQKQLTEPRLLGELEDVKRKLDVFERMGHETILKEHSRREAQYTILKEALNGLTRMRDAIQDATSELALPELDTSAFDPSRDGEQEALSIFEAAKDITAEFKKSIDDLLRGFQTEIARWSGTVRDSEVIKLRRSAKEAYDDLSEQLAKTGVANMQQYGVLVQKRSQLEKELKEVAALAPTIKSLDSRAAELCAEVERMRREITDRRQAFVANHIGENPAIRIRVSPYSLDTLSVERQWREMLARPTTMAEPFLAGDGKGGMIGELFDNLPIDTVTSRAELHKRVTQLKREVQDIVAGGNPKNRQGWLVSYFRSLPPETLDCMECWWPDDNLEIDYAVPGSKGEFRPIQQGSPGQKTAGVLAFLMAFGTEPMILDQPEDDLDNQLIYDLIVSQLRENKKRRQVIIVTHNPNIVVNGDAEYVIPLDFRRGQTMIFSPPGAGSLQSRDIRDEVCRVMEGGKDAFSKRYRRLALENTHV